MCGLYSQVHYLCYAPVWLAGEVNVGAIGGTPLRESVSMGRLLRSAPEERCQRIHRCRAELDPSSQGCGERNPSVLRSHLVLLRDPFTKSQMANANKDMAAKEVNSEATTHISTRLTITPQRLFPLRKESRASEQKAQAKLCK